MRKIKYSVFVLLLLSSISYTQILNHYGLKVGYVSASETFTYKIVDDITTRKSGISFGVFADLFHFYNFSISPEIKYIQKGVGLEMEIVSYESPNPVGSKTEYIYHNYLSIPISFVYTLNFGFGKPFIKLGPRIDILIDSDADFDISQSEFKDYKNVVGGTISLGIIPNFHINFNPFFELSYHYDFSNTYSGENNKIKNNAIELSLGLQL